MERNKAKYKLLSDVFCSDLLYTCIYILMVDNRLFSFRLPHCCTKNKCTKFSFGKHMFYPPRSYR